jgi:hypothetical protein
MINKQRNEALFFVPFAEQKWERGRGEIDLSLTLENRYLFVERERERERDRQTDRQRLPLSALKGGQGRGSLSSGQLKSAWVQMAATVFQVWLKDTSWQKIRNPLHNLQLPVCNCL